LTCALDYSDGLNNFLEFKTHTEGINLEYNGELSKFYEEVLTHLLILTYLLTYSLSNL